MTFDIDAEMESIQKAFRPIRRDPWWKPTKGLRVDSDDAAAVLNTKDNAVDRAKATGVMPYSDNMFRAIMHSMGLTDEQLRALKDSWVGDEEMRRHYDIYKMDPAYNLIKDWLESDWEGGVPVVGEDGKTAVAGFADEQGFLRPDSPAFYETYGEGDRESPESEAERDAKLSQMLTDNEEKAKGQADKQMAKKEKKAEKAPETTSEKKSCDIDSRMSQWTKANAAHHADDIEPLLKSNEEA